MATLLMSAASQAQVIQVNFTTIAPTVQPAPSNITFSPAGTYAIPAQSTLTKIEVQIGSYLPAKPGNPNRVFVPTPGTAAVQATAANGTWTAPAYTNLTSMTDYAFQATVYATPTGQFGSASATVGFKTP